MLKFTKVFAATLLVAAVASYAQADLIGSLILDESGIAASDGVNALTVDTYLFNVENTESSAVTSIEMAFSGNFWVVGGINATFRDTPAMPQVFGQNVADSFFIADGSQLVGNSVDTVTTLSGAWTLPGDGTPVISSGATETMAYLVVPTGEVPTYDSGRGAVAGAFVDIVPGGTEDPILGIAYSGPGADLSAGLQGAFASNDGTSFVLADAVMATNEGEGSLDLGLISGLVTLDDDSFAEATLTDADNNGKFDLTITVPEGFSSLDPKTGISGVVSLSSTQSGVTQTPEMSFSIAVPEPSTVALSCLALVGLVGFARRK